MVMNGCEGVSWGEQASLLRVRAQKPIRVLTLQHPLVYEKPALAPARGIEQDLLRNFAKNYDLRIQFIPKKNWNEVIEALRQGEGDIAAGRLRTPDHRNGFLPGPAFEETHLSLFCDRRFKIRRLSDLAGRRVALSSKDNVDFMTARLRSLIPQIRLQLNESTNSARLLEQVALAKQDCAIVENLEGAWFSRTQPGIEKVMSLGNPYTLSWILPPDRTDISILLNSWFQKASREDEIMRVHDRYQAMLSELDRADVRQFLRHLRTRWPKYENAFRRSATEHGLDWRLLASIAYQESHWDEGAESYTGVKGLMQLTEETAQYVGVTDRTDPWQSIWGGASYLSYLVARQPSTLDIQDRWALALASYNCGPLPLRNAQILAQQRGLNPGSWKHLKQLLPLLEDPTVAARLGSPLARGRETVQFVERVRAYYSLWNQLGPRPAQNVTAL